MRIKLALQIGLRSGLIMGVISLFTALIGMFQAFANRIHCGQQPSQTWNGVVLLRLLPGMEGFIL